MSAQASLFGDLPEPRAIADGNLPLLDAAAERAALASGRPKSQERAILVAGSGLRCLRDHRLTKMRSGSLRCLECDGTAVRYIVRPDGGRYEVYDVQGGWVCSTHKSVLLAQKRADGLNAPA